jgi:hypothetical protein
LEFALQPRELDVSQPGGARLPDLDRAVCGVEEEATVISSGDGADGSRLKIAPEEIETPSTDIVVSRDDEKRDFQAIDGLPHEPILLLRAVFDVVAREHRKGNAAFQVTVCITDERKEVAIALRGCRGDMEVAEVDPAEDAGLIESDGVVGIGGGYPTVAVH